MAIENAWLYTRTDEALATRASELSILLDTSNAVSSTLDLVSACGGGEFAIILAETNKMGAVSAAKRLGNLVEETSFEGDDILPQRSFTVSVGVAECPTDARKKIELAAKADQALQEAKALGGNSVRTAGKA